MFVVVYKFTVTPGMEDSFREAWRRLTEAIFANRGSCGSRLHRGQDGVWFAYAQWPSREVWEQAGTQPSADIHASVQMRACLAGPVEALPGDVSDDLLR